MGLTDLKIIFDNPHHTYYAGETVSGRLHVTLDAPKKLRSIIAKFKGEAECRWSETRTVQRSGKSERETIHYRGYELYFEHRITLFAGSGTTEILPAGEHWYQFSMMLPQHLPSSFEGNHGHIRYTVKTTLDRPWKFDHEAKAAFTVISHVDLNLNPANREPLKTEDHKTFCCCCCESGPLTLATYVPARGYVPGQSIDLTVEVDNASNVNIHGVVCELQKYVTYYANHPRRCSKEDHVVVGSIVFDGSVNENDSKTWCRKLTVPPLPPSILRECSIIDLEYKLKIKAKPEGLHADLINAFTITIGTIPLWQTLAPTPMPMPMPMPDPSAPSTDMAAAFMPPEPGMNMAPSAPPYPDMPPPTYQECMFGTTSISDSDDNQHVFGTTGYNPRYPTYSIMSTVPGNSAIGCAPPRYEDVADK